MPDPGGLSLTLSVVLFLAAGVVILLAGTRLAGVADVFADRTGLGEAVVGALFLAAATSMGGIVTSLTTAFAGNAELSVSNAVGGIAAQTVFLAIADIVYRGVNLEHAAASVSILAQGALLISLLAIPLMAMSGPNVTFLAVHPASLFMIAGYVFGLRMIQRMQAEPMWEAYETSDTRFDVAEEENSGQSVRGLLAQFAVLIPVIAAAGWVLGQTAGNISAETGLSQTLVGGLFTGIVTSLPELVTTIAAVRRGALTLAVSGIIGGNAFDSLVIAFSDVAYRDGSIYHAVNQQVFLLSLTVLLTGILLLGLLRRERRGIADIGFESFLVITVYAGAFAFLALGG